MQRMRRTGRPIDDGAMLRADELVPLLLRIRHLRVRTLHQRRIERFAPLSSYDQLVALRKRQPLRDIGARDIFPRALELESLLLRDLVEPLHLICEPEHQIDAFGRRDLEGRTGDVAQPHVNRPTLPAGVSVHAQASKRPKVGIPVRLAGVRSRGGSRRPNQRFVRRSLLRRVEYSRADLRREVRRERSLRFAIRGKVTLQLLDFCSAELSPTAELALIAVVRGLKALEPLHLGGRPRMLEKQRIPRRERFDLVVRQRGFANVALELPYITRRLHQLSDEGRLARDGLPEIRVERPFGDVAKNLHFGVRIPLA